LSLFFFDKEKGTSTLTGPTQWPIIGCLPEQIISVCRNRTLDFTLENYLKYGKAHQTCVLGNSRIAISETEDLKYFLVKNAQNYEKSPNSKLVFHPLFGDGIFNTDGKKWQHQREAADSIFHCTKLKTYIPVFIERAQTAVDVILPHLESNEPIDMQSVFMKFTMDSIMEIAFGLNIDSLRGEKRAVAFSNSFDYVQAQTMVRLLTYPIWKVLPQQKFQENLFTMNSFMMDLIKDRKKEIESGVDVTKRMDVLSRFITSKNEKGTSLLQEGYLLDVLKNFLAAGRDTTACTLTWALYLISQHPDVEQKLLDEIKEVTSTEGITYESIAKLKYMKQVIDETLRLYPPVPIDSRHALSDDILPSGHHVKAGTVISYCAYAQHRFEDYFPDPFKFNPDRWETDYIKPFSFVPFHGGPRICPGQIMAYHEIKVAFCTLLPKFKFTLVKDHPVMYAVSLTLPAKYGIKMHVSRRC